MGNDGNDRGFVEHPNLVGECVMDELYAYAAREVCISSARQLSFTYLHAVKTYDFQTCLYSTIYVSTHSGHVGSDVNVSGKSLKLQT